MKALTLPGSGARAIVFRAGLVPPPRDALASATKNRARLVLKARTPH